MTTALLANSRRNLALEVARGERSVVFVALNGERYELMKWERSDFDHEFCVPAPTYSNGVEPTPRRYARFCLQSKTFAASDDATAALLNVLPLEKEEPRPMATLCLLVEDSGTFLGVYENVDDARLVQARLGRGNLVRNPADLTEEVLMNLRQQVAPTLKSRSPRKLAEGVFAMATNAAKPALGAPKKVEKTVKERVARKDGPIAKVKEYVAKHEDKLRSGALSRAQARQALLEQGINKTTVSVQLQRWLEEFKINAQSGGRVRKTEDGKFEVAKPKEPKTSTPKAAKASAKPAKTTKAPKATKANRAASKAALPAP